MPLTIINSIGHKCGYLQGLEKRQPLCGLFGIRLWLSINGGACIALASMSKHWVLFYFILLFICLPCTRELVKPNFWIAFRPKEHGGEPISSCITFLGVHMGTMITSIANNPSLGTGSLRRFLRQSSYGICSMHYPLYWN